MEVSLKWLCDRVVSILYNPIKIQDLGTSPCTLLPVSFWVSECTPFFPGAYKCPGDSHTRKFKWNSVKSQVMVWFKQNSDILQDLTTLSRISNFDLSTVFAQLNGHRYHLHTWVFPPTWIPFKGYSRSFPLANGSVHFTYDHALPHSFSFLPVCVPLI